MTHFDLIKLKNKNMIFASALILIMALGAIAAPLLSTVKAQTLSTIPTELFMSAAPNPIGVGQTITATVWLSLEPIEYSATGYYGWNFTVNVITPSGSNTTLGPFESAPTGGYFTTYKPTVAGNYTFQAYFPLTIITIPPGTSTYAYEYLSPGTYTFPAAESSAITVNVQSKPIQAWPETPLPTSYWQNPIFAENQNWYVIAGNWLISPAYTTNTAPSNPALYTSAPNTAHILWTKPLAFGGISGGQYSSGNTPVGSTTPYTTSDFGVNYYSGLLYQEYFSPIIISGYLYYEIFPLSTGLPGVDCINLRTGALVWSNSNMPQAVFGQVLTFQSGDQSGSLAYLWASTAAGWQLYDAFTGTLLTTFINIPTEPSAFGPSPVPLIEQQVSPLYGPNGEILVYAYDSTNNWLAMWNSTLAVLGPATEFGAEQYTPEFSPETNWAQGIQWNVTIPYVPGNPILGFGDYADGVLVAEGFSNADTTNPIFEDVGYSVKTGAQLWQVNRTNDFWGAGGPGNPGLISETSANPVFAYGDGYYAFLVRETLEYHIINIETGVQVAVTEPLNTYTNSDYSYYDWGPQISYGMLITTGYSGDVVAFNVTNGQHLWTFEQINSGLQTPYGTWPTFGSSISADGKIYLGFTQHSPGTPLFRGYNLYCLNATTGDEIWQLPGLFPTSSLAIADGELVGYAGYDNQIYAFGTGLSATTVSAEQNVRPLGSEFQIQGTVTDQSPGQTCLGIPAAGTPAIADAYMDQWMSYLYQQQPEPMNATGVPVTLTALDPNGNIENLGTTTSNINGNYAIDWTPPVPGLYTITATFSGTNSYSCFISPNALNSHFPDCNCRAHSYSDVCR